MASTGDGSIIQKKGTKFNPAKWDDDKTITLLEVIEAEITAGNRPRGVFSKQGWKNVVSNFNEKSGMHLNKDQIKNKQDNLRREYTKWESLIGKEIGLGWDHERRTFAAPDELWAEKAKVDPSIMRYKESGPTYLDLLQKIFGGVIATGYKAYIPLHPDCENLQEIQDERLPADDANGIDDLDDAYDTPVDLFSDYEVQPTQGVGTATMKLDARKRKRQSSSIKLSTADRICSSIDSFSQTMRLNVDAIESRRRVDDVGLSYSEALDLLRGIPGMGTENPVYWKGVRVLEDRIRPITFGHVMQDGVVAVNAWLSTFPDFN